MVYCIFHSKYPWHPSRWCSWIVPTIPLTHGWVCHKASKHLLYEKGAPTSQLQSWYWSVNLYKLHFGQVRSELTSQTRPSVSKQPITQCAPPDFSMRLLFCHRLVTARKGHLFLKKEEPGPEPAGWLSTEKLATSL